MFDVRNNVMYDYGKSCSVLTGDHLSANYVANYIHPEPRSARKKGAVLMNRSVRRGGAAIRVPTNGRLHQRRVAVG